MKFKNMGKRGKVVLALASVAVIAGGTTAYAVASNAYGSPPTSVVSTGTLYQCYQYVYGIAGINACSS
jgi:hypothetical protein